MEDLLLENSFNTVLLGDQKALLSSWWTSNITNKKDLLLESLVSIFNIEQLIT